MQIQKVSAARLNPAAYNPRRDLKPGDRDYDASDFDVSLTGFDEEEIDALMNKFYSAEAVEDDFDREKAAAEMEAAGGAITQPGDLWELGSHRLYCGDPALAESYGRLMGTEQAAFAMAAPPALGAEEYKKDGLVPWM